MKYAGKNYSKYLFVLLLNLVWLVPHFASAQVQGDPLTTALSKIDGLTYKEVLPSPNAKYRVFDMEYKQPADHNNLAGPWFEQRLILWHLDTARPMVLQTSGYAIFGLELEVLATEFNANQIQVEHRFFANSVPANSDWTLDTIEQSANDFHRVTQAFKSIYTAKWVNTGRSKGGMTSVYHRRFFPNDLDATVAHVAPDSFSVYDPRYSAWVSDAVGGDANALCRERLVNLQRLLLQNKPQIEASLDPTQYTFLGSTDIAVEHSIIELPFTYWQYDGPSHHACASIPNDAAPNVANDIAFLNTVNPPSGYSDAQLASFTPYYYQAATQLGNPGSNLSPIQDLLAHAATYNIFTYAPKGVTATYDKAAAMKDVSQWIAESSERMLYVYGGFDAWSGGPFVPRPNPDGDSYIYFAPGLNHETQFIDLKGADHDFVYQKIRSWLDITNDPQPDLAEPKALTRRIPDMFSKIRPRL